MNERKLNTTVFRNTTAAITSCMLEANIHRAPFGTFYMVNLSGLKDSVVLLISIMKTNKKH